MNTFSDVERYEVDLIDSEGNKNHFIARVRNFDFLDTWNKMQDDKQKATKAGDHRKAIQLQYEMMAFLFNVETNVMKVYSDETIVMVINDFASFVTKKTQAQEKTEK
jgi:hypothetical protein